METDNVNARVTYLVDNWSRVIHERDFHTVREAEDWLFEEMKVAYRRGAEEVAADWESSGGTGAALQLCVI